MIEINNLKSPYKIFPNQLLKVPDHKTQDPISKIKFVNKPVNLNTYKEEARNWITFYASEGTTVFSADAGEVIISGPDIPGIIKKENAIKPPIKRKNINSSKFTEKRDKR